MDTEPTLFDLTPGQVRCAVCSAVWSGAQTAHCAGECHQTFTDIKAFDAHRLGMTRKHPRGWCETPEAAGLVSAERAYPCWTTKGSL